MATARPFAYNTGSTIPGTEQLGDLSIGAPLSGFTDNPQFWNGPDEDLGYVIGYTVVAGNQPNPVGIPAYVQFWRSKFKTDESFIELSEYISRKQGSPQTFATVEDAEIWLSNNGFWSSLTTPVTATPTPTLTQTPTVTPTTSEPTRFVFNSFSATTYGESCPSTSGATIYGTNSIWGSNSQFYNNSSGPVTTDMTGYYNYLGEVWSIDSVGQAISLFLCPTPTETPSPTATPTPTPSVTQTMTPTNTPTPSSSPIPVTGYPFNLIVLPYNYPSSGNTIISDNPGGTLGTLNPNNLAIFANNNGIYWNTIDSTGSDRTSYFSQFTGQSVTLTISQTGSTAIYSGDSKAFQYWSGNTGDPGSPIPGKGFTFGSGFAQPGFSAGTATLIQSASTLWVSGVPVYISAVVNSVTTPTPTPTETQTPTVTTTPSPTSSPSVGYVVNMTLSEVSGDVVLSGSGTLNTTSLGTPILYYRGATVVPSGSQFGCGVAGPGPFNCYIFTGGTVTSPANFGTGGQSIGDSGTGDFFGIGFNGSNKNLFIPTGYTSGSFISGTTTFALTDLATMGATPGTYTWSWGSGANASSIVLQVIGVSVTPTPTTTSTPTNTITPSPTTTPTPTATPIAKVQIYNNTTGSRTVTSLQLDGSTQSLTQGSYPITAGNDGFALTHGVNVGVNGVSFNFGGSGSFDLYSYLNGNLVQYLSSYNNSSYTMGGTILQSSDTLILRITDPGALPTPTTTSSPTPTPTVTNTSTVTPTPSSSPTVTPTTTTTPTPSSTSSTSGFIVAAGGVNTIGYSSDGDSWVAASNSSTFLSQPALAVATNGTIFVAGGSIATNSLIYSTDGNVWSGSTNGATMFTTSVQGIGYGGGKFVAVGISAGAAKIAYSLDGITWSAATNSNIFGSAPTAVAFNGSRWVATAQKGGGNTNTIAYSDDGITWSAATSSWTIFSTTARGIAWGDNRWVAVGDGTNRFAYSNDGITWSATTNGNSIITSQAYGIYYNGTDFVAGGVGTNTIAKSNDGLNWTGSTNGNSTISTICYCITWDGSKWIAGGLGTNQLATSADGLTWSATTNGNTVMSSRVRALAVRL